jgi:hypothetical protein
VKVQSPGTFLAFLPSSSSTSTHFSAGDGESKAIATTLTSLSLGPPPHAHPQQKSKTRRGDLANAGVFLDTLIADGAVGKVWAGDMCIEQPSPSWRRVVAKIAIGEKNGRLLMHEAKIYQFLVAQLPPVGPHCYGIFQDRIGTTVLLTDYLGKRLNTFADEGLSKFVFWLIQ